jgi:hypothetical protein
VPNIPDDLDKHPYRHAVKIQRLPHDEESRNNILEEYSQCPVRPGQERMVTIEQNTSFAFCWNDGVKMGPILYAGNVNTF